MALTDKLTAIADAIREKTGSTDAMTLDEMVTNISGITSSSGSDDIDALLDGSITEISNDTVTSLKSYAFYNCTSLESVSFSAATSVGSYCFSGCTSLTSVSLPVLTTTNARSFYGCTSLESVSFSAATSLGTYCFYNCTSLTSASFPLATSLGTYCFYGCISLTSASFPLATSLASSIFASCTSLTYFDLYASCPQVTTMGACAFQSCTGLAHVFIPSTITTIYAPSYSYAPFYKCSSSCIIYTDVEDEDSIPSGWGTCWNYYDSGSQLEVVYGVSHDTYLANYVEEEDVEVES